MDVTFAHYRNRFCMFRTYYALAVGKVKPDGINMKVIELAYPQEKLLDVLQSGKADAVVLLDHFFFRGDVTQGVRCLYTDGDAWKELHGFDEMIKHMVAAREDLLRQHPGIKDTLLKAFRASF